MKPTKMLSTLCIAIALGVATTAQAVIIDLGIYDPPMGGESAEKELAFLNSTVIPDYNADFDPNLPTATFGTENINFGGVITIDLDVSNYDYLKLKWDGKWQFYYLGDEVGTFTFDSTVFNSNGQPQELSHYTFFSPGGSVPDGGTTALLLGLGLVTLSFIARRRSLA